MGKAADNYGSQVLAHAFILATHLGNYQGSCRGVGRFVPKTGSAVPMSLDTSVRCSQISRIVLSKTYPGPRGAQYCPVLLTSKSSTKAASDFAASSGVTARQIPCQQG